MVMRQLNIAQKAARKAIESTYNGLCTIIEYGNIKDERSKITRQGEVAVLENQPCKLSFEKLTAAVQTDSATVVSQGIKLFVAPEVTVKPGSKIIVKQDGVTTEYSVSGKPAVYYSHQEVMLELFDGWA